MLLFLWTGAFVRSRLNYHTHITEDIQGSHPLHQTTYEDKNTN